MSRRWVYKASGEVIEVTDAYTPETRASSNVLWNDRAYEGLRSPIDGVDIGTRTRHREYMRDRNLATMDDFKGQWEGQAKERDALRNGTHDRKQRREQVGRAIHQLETRK